MKPWAEWLLMVALGLLILAVLVAVVIAFVRWMTKGSNTHNTGRDVDVGAMTDFSAGGDTANLEFDLSTPKTHSTIWKRRKQLKLKQRNYTALNSKGIRLNISVLPDTTTMTITESKMNVTTNNKYSLTTGGQFYLFPESLNWNIGLEEPGYGIVLGKTDGVDTHLLFGFPQHEIDKQQHYVNTGSFACMHFSSVCKLGHATITNTENYNNLDLDKEASAMIRIHQDIVHLASQIKEENKIIVKAFDEIIATKDGEIIMTMNDNNVMLLTPPLLCADLPFPVRAKYHILFLAALSTPPSSSSPSPVIIKATIYISVATSSITIVDKNTEKTQRIFQGNLFSGKIQPLSKYNIAQPNDLTEPLCQRPEALSEPLCQRPEALTEPLCYGLFIAHDDNNHQNFITIQFTDKWCFLSGIINTYPTQAAGFLQKS